MGDQSWLHGCSIYISSFLLIELCRGYAEVTVGFVYLLQAWLLLILLGSVYVVCVACVAAAHELCTKFIVGRHVPASGVALWVPLTVFCRHVLAF